MIRRLLTPRLVLSHVLVLAVVVAMANLGFWQLRRLDEVRSRNDTLESRLAEEPVPLGALLPIDDPAAVEFRRVSVTGRYATAEEVLQRSQSHQGNSGYHVITPLVYAEGRAVLVRRGWVPFELDDPPVDEAAPPAGEVTVTGWLERSGEQPGGFGQRDPDEGTLDRVFHVDTARLDRQTSADLLPVVLHLDSQRPAQSGELPVPAPAPSFDSGTHLSYAVQWFLFSIIALAAYAFWLRRRVSDAPRTGSG